MDIMDRMVTDTPPDQLEDDVVQPDVPDLDAVDGGEDVADAGGDDGGGGGDADAAPTDGPVFADVVDGGTCGANGQPCCAGDSCGMGLMCAMGACVPACGGRDQPCCTTGVSCAGSLACMDGVCRATSCSLGEGNTCMPGAGVPDCCADDRMCADTPLGTTACCRGTGGACTSNAGCCGSLGCVMGTCQTVSMTCLLEEGAFCTPGGGALGCCADGRTCSANTTGSTACCRHVGGACTSNSGCCGTAVCVMGTCR